MDPTYPWGSLGGKEELSWQGMWYKATITTFGKRRENALLKHPTKRDKNGSKFKFELEASLRVQWEAQWKREK